MEHTNKHHILPRSRGGIDDHNIVELPKAWHDEWHRLFGNMTNEEIVEFIQDVMVPGKHWTQKELYMLQNIIRRRK